MMSNISSMKDEQVHYQGRPYNGESQEDRVNRRKQQFLDSGLELFGTLGYRNVTVRGLCRQAKLTDRYFYESFTSTEDLLVSVYLNCLAKIQKKLLQTITEVQLVSDARVLILAGLDAFFSSVEDKRVARIVWLEILGVSPLVDQVYNEGIHSFACMLLGIIRTRYPKWSICDEDSRILGVAMIGAISQSTMDWLLSDYRSSRQTMVTATSYIFMGLITEIELSISEQNLTLQHIKNK